MFSEIRIKSQQRDLIKEYSIRQIREIARSYLISREQNKKTTSNTRQKRKNDGKKTSSKKNPYC
ncbi:MAG: hypothetical protein WBD50_05465 [Candidatus Rhabdochlamydia sp.]